jgi:tripartite-type tricarboxylate transporter receptor subunit TctC
VKELVGPTQSEPTRLAYGSNGNGTAQHLIGTQFENRGGAQILQVPYQGCGPLTTDLLGGQITMPFDIGTGYAVLAPVATPKEVVARLNAEAVKVIQSPEFRKRMADIGAEPVGGSSDQMAKQINYETERFARMVKEAHVVIE